MKMELLVCWTGLCTIGLEEVTLGRCPTTAIATTAIVDLLSFPCESTRADMNLVFPSQTIQTYKGEPAAFWAMYWPSNSPQLWGHCSAIFFKILAQNASSRTPYVINLHRYS